MLDRFDVTRLPRYRGRRGLFAGVCDAVAREVGPKAGIWRGSPIVQTRILHGALAEALSKAKLKKVDFRVKRCRVMAVRGMLDLEHAA